MKHCFLIHKWHFLSPTLKVCEWCGLIRYDYRWSDSHIPIIEDYLQLVDYDNEDITFETALKLAEEENIRKLRWTREREKNRQNTIAELRRKRDEEKPQG